MSIRDDIHDRAAELGIADAGLVAKAAIQEQTLRSMDKTGLLDDLVLQGGSAIGGCYGGLRLSEDLDFIRTRRLKESSVKAFSEDLTRRLESSFEVRARVKEPDSVDPGNGGVLRWSVIVDDSPERPELPSHRMKIEVGGFPAYSSTARAYSNPAIGLPSPDAPVLLVETPDEIVADKIVSFVNSKTYLRLRDLYDIEFLRRTQGIAVPSVAALVQEKLDDYGVESLRPAYEQALTRFSAAGGAKAVADGLSGMLIPAGRALLSSARQTEALCNGALSMFDGVLREIDESNLSGNADLYEECEEVNRDSIDPDARLSPVQEATEFER